MNRLILASHLHVVKMPFVLFFMTEQSVLVVVVILVHHLVVDLNA